jgi:Cytochrome c oxidase assembly protein CtaG/Cox11
MHEARDIDRGALAESLPIIHMICPSAIIGVVACMVMLTLRVGVAMGNERDAILLPLRAYMAAVYARDYAEAYRWIATADRRLKSQADYEQDNEAFKGASQTLARRLAQAIVIQKSVIEGQGERAAVRARLTLPNGNAHEVSDLLLAEGGLAEAPPAELEERMAKLEALILSGKLPTVEVEEEWTLVRDPEGWRVFLDWGSGVRIQFATHVPKGLDVTATFDRVEVLTPRGETLQLRLKVRNHGTEPARLKVVHRVEPAALEPRLDLVQCGYLFPRDVAGGGADESPVVYFVDEDLPKDVAQLRVTLEFVALE